MRPITHTSPTPAANSAIRAAKEVLEEMSRWPVSRTIRCASPIRKPIFERTELTLHEDDALILYTDGVSEAFNPQEECYGSERLLADATALGGQTASAITKGLLQKVRAFAGTAPQSDDIAILALKVNGNGDREGGS